MSPKPSILRHSIVLAPSQFNDGWMPKFAVQLTGPIPSAAQLVAEVTGPGPDEPWLELAWDLAETGEEVIQDLTSKAFV